MRSLFAPSVMRVRVEPDDPRAVVGRRPRGTRRPHRDATVAEVRRLIEQTELTYAEIAKKTGVARASICRWTRDGGWQRPVFAPRATDTVPTARASANLRRRTLAARLAVLAERAVRELEEAPAVDLEKLAEALELMKLAKLAARRSRRGKSDKASAAGLVEAPPREAMKRLRAAGVDTMRAPGDALEDFVRSRAPRPERAARSRRRFTGLEYHRWLLQREGE
ncbi:hypothetical protein RA307_28525 [Xanthobacteraceae bacterium Astr-EGSB]|uniref:hypothetical protein n=1 Tax=Astrobacterium formosum TaxID=3069710 RepID=UPI0027B87358|nr:hypothetical protein [Xanthobacteraceae bacterium Astr-EGSB]